MPPAESVKVIRDEVTRCDRILTHLMDYARLSEGRIESVDVNQALETALAQARSAVSGHQLEIVHELAPTLPPLPAQRAQLEECFTNLIQNAIEAMPAGGRLTLASRYLRPGQVEVEISDNGEGIAQDKIGKVFEAFYTTRHVGTGLGLAIVKNIVETYNGTVSVVSPPGRGTRFRVVFPLQAAPGEAPQ